MTDPGTDILAETQSLCPECLRQIPAYRRLEESSVFLEKRCPEHGLSKTIIWRGHPCIQGWSRPKMPSNPDRPATSIDRGCPFDCGLCPDHRQHTCTALLEVTHRCNLMCRICFAGSGRPASPDPGAKMIRFWYDRVLESAGTCNIQLSGGEPTVRNDLPAIIHVGKQAGFSFIQLNTNGIRIAEETEYAEKLKDAGLASVFLQFDGISDAPYLALRGRPLADLKKRAVEACARSGLGIVLVPTLVPGINTDQIGTILNYGLSEAPAVRGVHFQPVSYFGRYPKPPQDSERITLPEVMAALERQTQGKVRADQFRPPGCENALCSFHGNFIILESGRLVALTDRNGSCCIGPEKAEDGARQTISAVARNWSGPVGNPVNSPNPESCLEPVSDSPSPCECDTLDGFLDRARTHTFGISAMAFQDAWTLDLERLRDCCIHVVAPDGRLIPFCAYNLTSRSGRGLYRS